MNKERREGIWMIQNRDSADSSLTSNRNRRRCSAILPPCSHYFATSPTFSGSSTPFTARSQLSPSTSLTPSISLPQFSLSRFTIIPLFSPLRNRQVLSLSFPLFSSPLSHASLSSLISLSLSLSLSRLHYHHLSFLLVPQPSSRLCHHLPLYTTASNHPKAKMLLLTHLRPT